MKLKLDADELKSHLEVAAPWAKDAAEPAHRFGLRAAEAARVTIHHINRSTQGLRFEGEAQKSYRDEEIYGGEPGWQLLLRLETQAIERGQIHLVTGPGREYLWNAKCGREVPREAWWPLKSVRKSWASSAKNAGIERPHRFHDNRGAYITQIAEKTESALLFGWRPDIRTRRPQTATSTSLAARLLKR